MVGYVFEQVTYSVVMDPGGGLCIWTGKVLRGGGDLFLWIINDTLHFLRKINLSLLLLRKINWR